MNTESTAFLQHQIGNDAHSLRRIHDYYLPVFDWLRGLVAENESDTALIVGINGQQGCGKSTLCHYLCELFRINGRQAITISVDDFYLTHDQQVELAAKNPANPYLQPRGYPGTHDIDLAVDTLTATAGLENGERMLLPRYDKSAFAGQGDRFSQDLWTEITGPVDLILFEGWMLGFSGIPGIESDDENMLQINKLLGKYSRWDELLDAFLHLDSDRLENVIDWRVEAEMNMKAEGKSGMSSDEVEAYARLFLPCYEIYLPRLRTHPPVKERYRRLELLPDRLPGLEATVSRGS